MKYILSLIIGGALVVSGFGQTRNVLVGTNNTVVQPTNFWSADASNARTGLGLGSAATSPVSAFQSSSVTLSNLASSNGGILTNIQASNIVGSIAASNIPSVTFTGITGTLGIIQGGTGATNAENARQNLGSTTVGDAVFIATNAASARTALGSTTIGGNIFTATDAAAVRSLLLLGTASTNPSSSFQTSSSVLTNLAASNGGLLTNLQASNLVGTIAVSNIPVVTLTNISGVLSVEKGGTGATNASDARTSLGATTVGNAVFVATNSEAARTALSLGTAATSAVTSFQPANANLTNLSTNNGASLTNIAISGVVGLQSNLDTKITTNGNASGLSNITAANISGTVALASNITGTAALATNVTGVVSIVNGGTGATNAGGARTALGATTVGGNLFTLVNPSAIRFLRLNADNTATALTASDFRSAIGLESSATNAETAFQPASTNLTTLASNNGSALTNLALSNVVGLQSALNGKLPTNGSASGLTDFVGTTNPATARTNIGLGWSALTNTDATNFRNAIGLGATNNAFAGLSVGSLNTNLSTNNSSVFGVQNFIDSNAQNSFAFGGANTVSNVPTGGGSVVMGLLGRMTNQGAFLFNGVPQGGTAGNSRGNNTFAVNASNGIYLNGPIFLEFEQGAGTGQGLLVLGAGGDVIKAATNISTATPAFVGWDGFGYTAFGAGAARTNLDIPWTGLTNTNATTFQAALFGSNTNPVLVNTSGSVVSPTNFWQVAPISTTVQYQTNVTGTSTNAATNSRNLFLFSLSPSVSGITNTVTLPTNPATTFEGDRATITHLAQTTNAVTAVRQLGAETNLITLNQLDETVLLMYRGGAWMLADNISYIEPIYFSGTNAAANAAASRTNLGLGLPALTNTNVTNFRTAIGLGTTNSVVFEQVTAGGNVINGSGFFYSGDLNIGFNLEEGYIKDFSSNTVIDWGNGTEVVFGRPLALGTNAAITRTNLGLGATNNVSFSNVTASGTLTATGTVTATTNLVVNGFVDFSTNHTNSNPVTNNQINDFIEIRVGTNQFWLPVYK
jgi:hypothetical protein